MASNKQVKIAMITGYLGAGKTTLLNHILSNTQGIRAAVIVNDIGEVNIDADLIAATGAVTTMDDSLIPMTNGCICCTLSEDLANQLRDIANSGNFDYIVIEASGVCEPMPIAMTISQFCEEGEDGDAPMALDNVIAVVDCARMFDEFNGGQDLVDEEAEEDDIVNLLINQIEFCSTLVLNKTDIVTPEQLAQLKAIVNSLQKSAKIIEAVKGQVPLEDLLNTGLFSFESAYTSAGWVDALEHSEDVNAAYEEQHEHHHDHAGHHHHDHEGHDHECDHHHDHGDEHEHHHHDHEEHCEHHHDHDDEHGHHGHHHHHHDHDHEEGHDHVAEFGIATFVYERRRPMILSKLQDYAEVWPKSIIRTKGMLWFDSDPDLCIVFEQAGQQMSLMENGTWAAAASPIELERIFEEYPDVREDWDPEVGDRRIKLVIIGRDMDRAQIEADLDACLG